MSAAILLIEESMKAMEGRHAAEIQGLQEANLLLCRDLYGVRDDLRDQAAAALTQANAALRDELGQLESKARTLENETFGRIKILEDELKKHEAHLQSSHDAKPEDARILTSCFKYLDEQVEKVKAATALANVPGPALLGRLDAIEAEIVGLKADVAAAGPVPLRPPPGYSQESPSLNLRGAYAAGTGAACGEAGPHTHGPGCGGATGAGGGDLRGVAAGGGVSGCWLSPRGERTGNVGGFPVGGGLQQQQHHQQAQQQQRRRRRNQV